MLCAVIPRVSPSAGVAAASKLAAKDQSRGRRCWRHAPVLKRGRRWDMTAPNPFQRVKKPIPRLLWTADETATALGVCRKTIFNMTRDGKLQAVMIGSRRQYAVADIEAFIESAKGVGQ